MYFYLHAAENGQYYFTIHTANRNVFCTSVTYHSRKDALDAIVMIKQTAAATTIFE